MDKTSQDRIGKALRQLYEGVSNEAIPDRFRPVLEQLERALDEDARMFDRSSQTPPARR